MDINNHCIKMVLCDIDDTLIHRDSHLRPETIGVIRELQRRDIFFTFATGRMPYRASAFAEDAGLKIPYIANNGSIIYDRGTYVYAKKVYAEILKDLLREYMRKNPDFTVLFSFEDKERPLISTPWVKERIHKYEGYDEPLGDTDSVWNQEVYKVYIVDNGRSGIIGEIANKLKPYAGEVSYFQYQQYSMEIVGAGCSKAGGLKILTGYLGIDASEVLAIGDDSNDIEMIKDAGLGVAVANAQEELKMVADYVTARERADGMAEAVGKYILRS